MGKKPLEGVRVLDFTQSASGPMATSQLADFGAEVIKVERPPLGDDSRPTSPAFKGTSSYFLSLNRGKKGITLDLKKEEAIEIARQLAEKSDIVFENFRPGVMSKLGLGYEDLKKINPRITYVSISGFGQNGPYAKRAAYDLVIQGLSGLMSVTGPDGGEWTKAGTSASDLTAGVFGAYAALLGFLYAQRTGEGCYMDVSMLDCTIALMEGHISNYLNANVQHGPIGVKDPYEGLNDRLRTSNGEIVCCARSDEEFAGFCQMLGLPELQNDGRFKTSYLRRQNDKELIAILEEQTTKLSSERLVEMAVSRRLPVSRINTIENVVLEEQTVQRNVIVDIVDSVAGKFRSVGSPVKACSFETPRSTTSPQLGEHTREVLRDVLGMDAKAIERALDCV